MISSYVCHLRRLVFNQSSPFHPVSESREGYRQRDGRTNEVRTNGNPHVLYRIVNFIKWLLDKTKSYSINLHSIVYSYDMDSEDGLGCRSNLNFIVLEGSAWCSVLQHYNILLQRDIMMEALLEKEKELQRLNAELDEKQRKMAAAATSPSPRKKVGDTSREPDTSRTPAVHF